MKAILEKDEILDMVKKQMEIDYDVEEIKWSDEEEIVVKFLPKKKDENTLTPVHQKVSPKIEKIQNNRPSPPSSTEKKLIEGRDTMTNDKSKRDRYMPVF